MFELGSPLSAETLTPSAPVLDYHITVTSLFINVTALSLMPPEMTVCVYVYAPLLRHQNFTS